MNELSIPPAARCLMTEDALRTFADECCGFMYGIEAEEIRTITAVADNSKEGDKQCRLEITPTDYIRAEWYAEDNGLALLGIYHSHPYHPAIPSKHVRAAAQPYFSCVIVSMCERQSRALQSWHLNGQSQFEEETIIEYECFNQA